MEEQHHLDDRKSFADRFYYSLNVCFIAFAPNLTSDWKRTEDRFYSSSHFAPGRQSPEGNCLEQLSSKRLLTTWQASLSVEEQ